MLENAQYALIATVQRLYTMVRNNEAWELGDPDLNDGGQPVIHDIAHRLGCILPSSDLPYVLPDPSTGFGEIHRLSESTKSELESEGNKSGDKILVSADSVTLVDTNLVDNSKSDHSDLSKDYNQPTWPLQLDAAATSVPPFGMTMSNYTSLPMVRYPGFDEEPQSRHASSGICTSIASSMYTTLQPESTIFRSTSPFCPWGGNGGDSLGGVCTLDYSTYVLKYQQPKGIPASPSAFDRDLAFNDKLFFVDELFGLE